MRLVLASNNPKKLCEMREILSDLDIEIQSQKEAGADFSVEETGKTFLENAYLKAAAVTEATGLPAIADDSGLMVEALHGEPGVYSARYGGAALKSDRERYEYLLKNMEGEENRRAKFVSAILCTFPNGDRLEAVGECHGEIAKNPRGEGGFGYDPVFYLPEFQKTMAEMAEEKNKISHRGKAIRLLREKLIEKLRGTSC